MRCPGSHPGSAARAGIRRDGTALRARALCVSTTAPTASRSIFPTGAVTVIEPVSRPAVPTRTARCWRRIRAPIDSPPLRVAGDTGAEGRHLRLRHHPRAAAPRDAAGDLRGDARRPRRGRHHPDRHRHAPDQHRRRARAHARPRHPRPLPRRQPRQPRRRRRSSASADVHRRAVCLNREWLAADVRITTGFVEPHFFAGFSGGPEDGGAGPGRARDGDDAARRRAHRPSRTRPGASPRAIRSTTTCARSRGWRRRTSRST